MSKQQQAPGQLELVREFVNTIDLEDDRELLGGPDQLALWLVGHGLAPPGLAVTEMDLVRATELREALRAVLLAHNGGPPAQQAALATLDAVATRACIRLRFGAGAIARLEPKTGGVDGALGRLLAIVHGSIAERTWERLKACREHNCEWAFYDHTKNRSGAWCSMGVCGNRAKARAYRKRHAAP